MDKIEEIINKADLIYIQAERCNRANNTEIQYLLTDLEMISRFAREQVQMLYELRPELKSETDKLKIELADIFLEIYDSITITSSPDFDVFIQIQNINILLKELT